MTNLEAMMRLSTISPMKASKTNQEKLVNNPLEEVELVNSLIWRQKTSMPIVKVLNFKASTGEHGYPNLYHI